MDCHKCRRVLADVLVTAIRICACCDNFLIVDGKKTAEALKKLDRKSLTFSSVANSSNTKNVCAPDPSSMPFDKWHKVLSILHARHTPASRFVAHSRSGQVGPRAPSSGYGGVHSGRPGVQ